MVGMAMPLTVEVVSVDGWCHWCLEWVEVGVW